jgi:hypothetical protein
MTVKELNQRRKLMEQYTEQIERLERERTVTQLENAQEMFGGFSSIAKDLAGEQSGIFQAMFAAEKAFSIATAIIRIQGAIADAADAGPFPHNLGAMATVVAQTAGIVSTIRGTQMSVGSKRFGGPVRRGQPEIVGEVGREIFIPSTDGRIVPNNMISGGGRGAVKVEINNLGPPIEAEAAVEQVGEDTRIRITVRQAKREIASDLVNGVGEVTRSVNSAIDRRMGRR